MEIRFSSLELKFLRGGGRSLKNVLGNSISNEISCFCHPNITSLRYK